MAVARVEKAMVNGLDGAEPSLVEAWRDELPTLSSLMERGVYGRLTSVVPPIAVPRAGGSSVVLGIVAAGAGVGARGRLDAHLLDIAPTVLDRRNRSRSPFAWRRAPRGAFAPPAHGSPRFLQPCRRRSRTAGTAGRRAGNLDPLRINPLPR